MDIAFQVNVGVDVVIDPSAAGDPSVALPGRPSAASKVRNALQAPAELDESTGQQRDERGDAATEGQPQQQWVDAAEQVIGEQGRGQTEDDRDNGCTAQTQCERGTNQRAGPGAALGHCKKFAVHLPPGEQGLSVHEK